MSKDAASIYKSIQAIPWRNIPLDTLRKEYHVAVKSIADPKSMENFDPKEGHGLLEAVLEAVPAKGPLADVPAFTKDLGVVIDRYASLAAEPTWRRILFVLRFLESKFFVGSRVLTVASAWAMELAYHYNFPAAVAGHLEAPILSVKPTKTGTTTDHYCRYFYFAGLIQSEYSRFDEAHALFETATDIHNAASEPFALAANKALFIVGAVAKQEVTSVNVAPGTNVYKSFAEAYIERPSHLNAYRQEIGKDSKVLYRLASLVCDDRVAQQILMLTKVYTNLPLDAVAQNVGLSKTDARTKIDLLVSSGRIGATIDAKDTVHFSDVDNSSREQVEEDITRAISLADHLEQVRTQVEISRDYVRSRVDFKIRLEKEIAVAAAGGGY